MSNTLNPSVKNSNTPKNGQHEDTESLIIPINTKDEFENYIKSTVDKYVLVYFFAIWCGPCKKLSMEFKELAEKYRDKIIVLKINIDDMEELAIEYDVTVMPSFTIVKNGEKLEHFFGSKTDQIDKMADKYLVSTT